MHVVVVGGGAAGFFAALSVAEHHPEARVTLLEKSDKLLSKVRISGGGRCNVTHACFEPRKLASNYPRGGRFLRKAFEHFNARDAVAWFERRGVVLKAEPDGRMFPVTNDSGTIVDLLMHEAQRCGVAVTRGWGVTDCSVMDNEILLRSSGERTIKADRVIITAGGHPKREGYAWMDALGHTIIVPVPSLFTFNMPDEPIRELMGVVVEPARVRIVGTELESTGPLLITHWGMSGPAVLKLSAWGARAAKDLNYRFTAQVNWLGGLNEERVRQHLAEQAETIGRKHAENADCFGLPKRMWAFLLDKAGIPRTLPWNQVTGKDRNRLIDLLTNDRYTVNGKTTFKEEFVTAGGIALDEVDPLTLRSRKVNGVYFAGEVLDIDGITGGFNFQAAWTTAYLAGKLG